MSLTEDGRVSVSDGKVSNELLEMVMGMATGFAAPLLACGRRNNCIGV